MYCCTKMTSKEMLGLVLVSVLSNGLCVSSLLQRPHRYAPRGLVIQPSSSALWQLPTRTEGVMSRVISTGREYVSSLSSVAPSNATSAVDFSKLRSLALADSGLLALSTASLVAAAACEVAIPSFSAAALSAGEKASRIHTSRSNVVETLIFSAAAILGDRVKFLSAVRLFIIFSGGMSAATTQLNFCINHSKRLRDAGSAAFTGLRGCLFSFAGARVVARLRLRLFANLLRQATLSPHHHHHHFSTKHSESLTARLGLFPGLSCLVSKICTYCSCNKACVLG